MRGIFYKIFRNFAKCFSPRYLGWHFLAIALTLIIVTTDFDWKYFLATKNIRSYAFPAAAIGGLMPILAPAILFLFGWSRKNFKIKNTAFALAQAAILATLISGIYKAFTGRAHPLARVADPTDITKVFHFGILRGGVFWGWPSTHTTIAFATVIALIFLYPKNKILKYLALVYALYIGLGVSMTIHWFSDFVAGAIFGSLIGIIVGKSFRQRYLSDK